MAWLSEIKATDEAHRAEFETWYAANAAHAEAFDTLLDTWDKTALIGATDEARARQHDRRVHMKRPRYMLAAAAAVLLAIAAGLVVLRTLVPFGGQRGIMQIASAVGELRLVTLADGSRVTLDTDTILRAEISDVERRIWLEHGRARFDVAHDSARPFVVAVDGGTVTARGTVFDVAFVDGRMDVGLLKGAVEVRRNAAGASGSTYLKPGQGMTLSVRSISTPGKLERTDTEWTSGMLSFADTPLVEAVASANRYSHTKILLGDDATRRLRVTGRFSAKDTSALASSLAATFHLAVTHDGAGNATLGQPAS